LADWYERTQAPITLQELFEMLNGGLNDGVLTQPMSLPLELMGHSGDTLKAKLGLWLRSHREEIIDGYRITNHSGRHTRWQVLKIGA
jgi:hypothetical protein